MTYPRRLSPRRVLLSLADRVAFVAGPILGALAGVPVSTPFFETQEPSHG